MRNEAAAVDERSSGLPDDERANEEAEPAEAATRRREKRLRRRARGRSEGKKEEVRTQENTHAIWRVATHGAQRCATAREPHPMAAVISKMPLPGIFCAVH